MNNKFLLAGFLSLSVVALGMSEDFLDLSHKFLSDRSLPDIPWSKLGKLRELRLAHNRLTTIPHKVCLIEDLENLDMSSNLLGTVPREIGLLKRLKKLDLSLNADLRFLPCEIGELSELMTLVLPKGRHIELPFQIGNLANLDCIVTPRGGELFGGNLEVFLYNAKATLEGGDAKQQKELREYFDAIELIYGLVLRSNPGSNESYL